MCFICVLLVKKWLRMWWGMDCRIAQENIDLFVDGLLSEQDRQLLLDHAASCAACQKAIDDAVRLKKALASLPEMEPPKGLAMSAIKKAKNKKPLFVYISAATAAVAAVIALVVVLTPGIGLNNSTRLSDGGQMGTMSTKEESGAVAEMAPAEDNSGYALEAPAEDMGEADDEAWTEAPEESVQATVRDMSAYVYTSEEDFVAAEQSSYYKPAALPQGAALANISMDEESFVFTYSLADGGQYTFAWLDALSDNSLKDWLKERYGDLSELNYDGSFYTFQGDGTTDVYWLQDGDSFHATVPSSWTAQDMAAYCKAQFVEVQETEELQ